MSEANGVHDEQYLLIAAHYDMSELTGSFTYDYPSVREASETPPSLPPPSTPQLKTDVEALFRQEEVRLKQGAVIRNVRMVAKIQTSKLTMDAAEVTTARRGVTQAILDAPERKFTHAELSEISASLGVTAAWKVVHPFLRRWWDTRLIIGARALIVSDGRTRRVNPLLHVTYSEEKLTPGEES